MPRVEKELMLDDLKGFLRENETVFMTEYSGIGAMEMTAFRKSLKKEGASCRVFKNTIMSNAFLEGPWKKAMESLSGPTMLVSAAESPVKIARVVSDFAKKHKGVKLKAGFVDMSFVTGEEIVEIAALPPKDVLLSKLLGGLMAPIASFVSVINAPVGAFVRVVNIISKQTGGDKDGREGN